jgi:ABC-2 type transport system permease protein
MASILANTVGLLISREFKRVLKEPSRLAGILIQPLLFLTVFGTGFHSSFMWSESSETSYGAFFYPGILGLVVLFSSIYATLSLVEDKKCGLFRLVIISPSGVFGAIVGKVAATALMGLGQSCLFLPLMIFFDIDFSLISLVQILVLLALGSQACAVLGVLFAWLSPSSAAFHALMSVVLIPMWLLSGAMFPIKGTWFQLLGFINPMTYLVTGLRSVMLGQGFSLSNAMALMLFSFLISVLLTFALYKRPLE